MNSNKMGRLIAKQRIKKELTQEQLAEKLRVDRTTVSKWERAISSPDISLLQLLAKELDLTIPELLNGEKNIQNEDIDSATINAIEFYNEKAKTKYRKWAIFLISLLTCFFLSLFIVNNYNKYEVYKINATGDDFLVTGYFIANHKRKIISINDIKYNNKYVGTDKELFANNITLRLISNDVILYTYSTIDDSEEKSIETLLNNLSILLDTKEIDGIDLKGLCLNIEVDNGNDVTNYSINLSVKNNEN